jgi:hypothetical protein
MASAPRSKLSPFSRAASTLSIFISASQARFAQARRPAASTTQVGDG